MKRIAILAFLILALAVLPALVQAQRVVRHPAPTEALSQKWQWATEQARQANERRGYWIGYSIDRLMGERSFIGSWSSRGDYITLHEVLYGERPEFDYRSRKRRSDRPERKVVKEVAILFAFNTDGDAREVDVANLSSHIDLEGLPLYWLGGAEDEESLNFVQRRYRDARSIDQKEELVMAIAIHDATGPVVDMLTDILTSDAAGDVRESAAFWLGQQDDPSVLDVLKRTAYDDRDHDVREQAVFAVSQMDHADATEILIDVARNGPRDIRKDAVFWLGQKASDRAVDALGDMVDDEDSEVQKQAVFAISQLPPDQSVPLLIEIARTHERAKVRKDAIFWLGQTDDPRALEALIELARG